MQAQENTVANLRDRLATLNASQAKAMEALKDEATVFEVRGDLRYLGAGRGYKAESILGIVFLAQVDRLRQQQIAQKLEAYRNA